MSREHGLMEEYKNNGLQGVVKRVAYYLPNHYITNKVKTTQLTYGLKKKEKFGKRYAPDGATRSGQIAPNGAPLKTKRQAPTAQTRCADGCALPGAALPERKTRLRLGILRAFDPSSGGSQILRLRRCLKRKKGKHSSFTTLRGSGLFIQFFVTVRNYT